MVNSFELTEEHIKLLNNCYIEADQNWGVPTLDGKRPYGSSSLVESMAEVLEIDFPDEYDKPDEYAAFEKRMYELHAQMPTALQIVLKCKTFEPGFFIQTDYPEWKRTESKRYFNKIKKDHEEEERRCKRLQLESEVRCKEREMSTLERELRNKKIEFKQKSKELEELKNS